MTAPFQVTYVCRDPSMDAEFPWLHKTEADAFRGRNIMTNERGYRVSDISLQLLIEGLQNLSEPVTDLRREYLADALRELQRRRAQGEPTAPHVHNFKPSKPWTPGSLGDRMSIPVSRCDCGVFRDDSEPRAQPTQQKLLDHLFEVHGCQCDLMKL